RKHHALIDYAHNPHSYEALGGFVKNWPGERIGVIGGPGDRRDEDFVTLGRLSAAIFDRVIVKEDDDTRGRPRGNASELILRGIEQIQPNLPVEVILDETTAVNTALDRAPLNSLVVILPESVTRAISLLNARRPVQTQPPTPEPEPAQNGQMPTAEANKSAEVEIDSPAEMAQSNG
ncbi:MAG: cyanophycin synthetase, partial [Leptolyngbyaceae cyanobacterium SM1_3_5]|nr:cyanophycin synthetase [Leptolyngbyaceae cyanobacterium SM1_3_5]